MKKTKHFISAAAFSIFIFLAFGSMDDDKKPKGISGVSTGLSTETPAEEMTAEKSKIIDKLKEKAKQDWPSDYTTQEYWVKEQSEAYDYMLTVDNNPIKEKAEKDWPLDFVTQKYWYNEQVEAKERMK